MRSPQANEGTLFSQSFDFVSSVIDSLPDEMNFSSPVEFTEEHRYIPESVSPRFPGYVNYAKVPFFKEILDCCDVRSPVREVAVKKGVQIGYTTVLESMIFYAAAQVKTAPCMYVTADLGLSSARITNNIIPMFQHSGMDDIFQSSDAANTRKKGVTKAQMQWLGGGYMLPYGAQSASKARQATILFLFLDEMDGWPIEFSKDGDPVRLFKDRCSGVWPIRFIFMGSTPLLEGSSHIDSQYERGDKRKYQCRCLKCGFPQELRWGPPPAYDGERYGMIWERHDNGTLDIESVRYTCQNCFHGHQEHDKPKFINEDNCYWEPTAVPVEPNIRSYHIPAMLSPVGMQPWYKCVVSWLDAWDPDTKRVKDHAKMRTFYNNILGKSYRVEGAQVTFQMASAHRRHNFVKNEIPNKQIVDWCGSEVVFLTCSVDVHRDNLAVAVFGWTVGLRCWLIDYVRWFDDSAEGCEVLTSPVWANLADLICGQEWVDDRGKAYDIKITLIDSGWSPSVVYDFCSSYHSGVYPIKGRPNTATSSGAREFSEFVTQIGTVGYGINVDYYKDRISPALRREWRPEAGRQEQYTFNAPMNTTDDELKELTVEKKVKKKKPNGQEGWEWYRPSGAANELWDLMVYGHAAVEILAWNECQKNFGLENTDWDQFWSYTREVLGTRSV